MDVVESVFLTRAGAVSSSSSSSPPVALSQKFQEATVTSDPTLLQTSTTQDEEVDIMELTNVPIVSGIVSTGDGKTGSPQKREGMKLEHD